MEKNKDLSLIISSCDKYKSLWEPFFTLLKKHWADCPFEVYLLSQNPDYPGIKNLYRKNKGWSTDVRIALEGMDTKYFILLSEECILKEKINTERILELLEIVKKEDICHLGLTPLRIGGFSDFKDYTDLVDVLEDPYRVNFQPGIWNKDIFLKVLKDGETIWEMEVNGSKRSGEFKPFVRVKDKTFADFMDAAQDGKIREEAAIYLKKEGFDFSHDMVFEVEMVKFPNLPYH